jgi:hypothetical protein
MRGDPRAERGEVDGVVPVDAASLVDVDDAVRGFDRGCMRCESTFGLFADLRSTWLYRPFGRGFTSVDRWRGPLGTPGSRVTARKQGSGPKALGTGQSTCCVRGHSVGFSLGEISMVQGFGTMVGVSECLNNRDGETLPFADAAARRSSCACAVSEESLLSCADCGALCSFGLGGGDNSV